MRIIAIIVVFFLSSCAEISDEEKSLVGYWEWEVSDGDYVETGFLHLRDDYTYSYRLVSKTPTEIIVHEKMDYSQYWRLKDNSVCTVIKWESATIFEGPTIIDEVCYWDVRANNKGEAYLTLNAGLSHGEISATRTRNQ